MLISHRHRFIYIKSRKTAGTSLEIGLSRYLGPDDVITAFGPKEDEDLRVQTGGRLPQNVDVPKSAWRIRDWIKALGGRPPRFSNHSPAYVIQRYLPGVVWDGYFKFTLDRNPWDLAVSAYHWFHRSDSNPVPFTQFVFSDDLAAYSNWRLYTIRDKIVVDRIYRYDHLSEATDDLSTRFGLQHKLELPRAKSTYRKDRRPYWEFYGESERRHVGEVFHKEIAEFGWRFGE